MLSRIFFRFCLILALFPVLSCAQTGDSFQALRNHMVKNQIEARGITDKKVIEAFRNVERHRFVLPKFIRYSLLDKQYK